MLRKRRPLGFGLLLLALAATLVLTIGVATARRSDGPLRSTSRTLVEIPTWDGEVVSWGMILPPNESATDIIIESIMPVGLDGLDLVGLGLHRVGAGGDESYTVGDGFPPSDIGTSPPSGAILPAGGPSIIEVLVGIRRRAGISVGTIAALHIDYRAGGIAYEVELPWGVKVNARGDEDP